MTLSNKGKIFFKGKLQKSTHTSSTFNGTNIIQSEIQKYIGMFLNLKLDFKEHKQNVFNILVKQ